MNYTVQFKYNGGEYSIPFQSDNIFKVNTHPQILEDQANIAAKNAIAEKSLSVENGKIESIRLYGNGDELLFEKEY